MDFLFELIFQIVFEFLAEALVEFGFQGAARVLRSRIGRYAVAGVVGFTAGFWWGDYLEGAGAGHRPRLLWVSLGLGVLSAIAAFNKGQIEPTSAPALAAPSTLAANVAPWRWPVYRLVGFSVLNFAIAAGIALGYTPPLAR